MTKLRFGIRSIATATVAVAIFCLGYRLGFERGNGQWEQLGGPTSMGGGISVLTTDGCKHYDIDSSGIWTASIDLEESDTLKEPFADINPFGDFGNDDDPFH